MHTCRFKLGRYYCSLITCVLLFIVQKSAAAVDSEEEEEQRQFEQELQQWKKTEVGLPSNVDTPSFSAHIQTGSFQTIKAKVHIQNCG